MAKLNRREFLKRVCYAGGGLVFGSLVDAGEALDLKILLLIEDSAADWLSKQHVIDNMIVEEKVAYGRKLRRVLNPQYEDSFKCLEYNLVYQIALANRLYQTTGLEDKLGAKFNISHGRTQTWESKNTTDASRLLGQLYNDFSDAGYDLVVGFTGKDMTITRNKSNSRITRSLDGIAIVSEKYALVGPNTFDMGHNPGAVIAHELSHCLNATHFGKYKRVEDIIYDSRNIERMAEFITENYGK